MKARALLAPGLIATILTAPLALAGESLADTYFGKPAKLGNGTARAYVTLNTRGKPLAIGVALTKRALEGLPTAKNSEGRCFDVNGNGKIDYPNECEGDYELALSLPPQANPALIPFKWVALNWNPGGHEPLGVYDLPHFDFHFYMLSRDAVYGIRLGSCGYFMHCDDYKRALLPVEAKYVHPDHVNVNAAVGAMGNHLIDLRSPEFFKPPVKFTHTWIFGVYDGHITFYEPMITRGFLESAPNVCAPIKQPQAWKKPGYYPTQYCIRYHPQRAQYTVSLEGLVERKAQ